MKQRGRLKQRIGASQLAGETVKSSFVTKKIKCFVLACWGDLPFFINANESIEVPNIIDEVTSPDTVKGFIATKCGCEAQEFRDGTFFFDVLIRRWTRHMWDSMYVLYIHVHTCTYCEVRSLKLATYLKKKILIWQHLGLRALVLKF